MAFRQPHPFPAGLGGLATGAPAHATSGAGVDRIVTRFFDVVFSFPGILLALLAVAVGTWRGRAVPTTTLATARDSVVIPPTLAFVPGSLRVPTDYFLDLATAPTTDEVPSIGDIDWYPLVPADDRGSPASTMVTFTGSSSMPSNNAGLTSATTTSSS